MSTHVRFSMYFVPVLCFYVKFTNVIAIAIYAINFVCFWYFPVKQRSFKVLNPAVLGPDWQLVDLILNINNVYFDNMVSQIYPSEPQLNKAYTRAVQI